MNLTNLIGAMCMALGGAAALAAPAAVARYELNVPAGAAHAGGAGRLQFIGAASVLIRYRGITLLTDPDAMPATLPGPDLVLLSRDDARQLERLLQSKVERKTPIVATEQVAARLRAGGFTRLYPLQTWDALLLKKGAARLRLTAMPGRPNGALGASRAAGLNAMLDFGAGQPGPLAPWRPRLRPPLRLYISGEALLPDDVRDLARRLPGADLALLDAGGTRLLGVLADGEGVGPGRHLARLIAPAAGVDVGGPPLASLERALKLGGWQGGFSHQRPGAAYALAPRRR
ncbi:MAG: hypothetical protein V4754_17435 [Pseudomonadota bacterium]